MSVTLYIAATMDGFIARENGAVDFLAPFESEDEDYGYNDFYSSVDGVILGRNTYDLIQEWVKEYPYGDKPSWLFTGRNDVKNSSITTVKAHPSEWIADAPEGNLWLVGGADLLRQFHNASLIDRYMISIIPAIIGRGIPLFLPGCMEKVFDLEESQTWSKGIVQNIYTVRDG